MFQGCRNSSPGVCGEDAGRTLNGRHAKSIHPPPVRGHAPASPRPGPAGARAAGRRRRSADLLGPGLAAPLPALAQAHRPSDIRIYQSWIHADGLPSLGPLEGVLNTPTHHRVHHASNPAYLDCNDGSSLLVFDRLFGSFVALRPDVEIRSGLTRPVLSNNPIRIAFHERLALGRAFAAARGARTRLKVLFGPP